MSSYLPRSKGTKNILLVFIFFSLIVTIVPQNVATGETQPVVNASEILVNITRGDPVYVNNNSIIVGDLDVSKIWNYLETDPKGDIKWGVVKSPIEIRDSTIQGNVNFNQIYFNDTVEFENVIFEGSASFYAVFDKRTIFQDSTFKSSANFGEATFNDIAYFGRVNFRDARFWNATFKNATFFRFSTVNGNAVFDNTFFNKSADFTHFVVKRDATFDNATFNDSVDFKQSTFNELAWFEDAKFNAPVNFIQATFSDTTVFQNAVFNTTAYFILARFKDRTYFTGAVFNDSVDFSEADIFQTMKINWNQLDGKLVYNNYFYQSLIKNFETLGQSDDWRDAYYRYHIERGKRIDTGSIRGLIRKVADFLLYIFCGYGVKPSWPLGWAVFWLILFTFVYMGIEEEVKWKRKGFWSSLWDSFFLSVCIFTSLGKWSSKWDNWEYAKKHEWLFRLAVIVEVFLGWIILVLFVISLTMTYIR
jgi:uncharacterized protein YjbI with pentapeptide repeats